MRRKPIVQRHSDGVRDTAKAITNVVSRHRRDLVDHDPTQLFDPCRSCGFDRDRLALFACNPWGLLGACRRQPPAWTHPPQRPPRRWPDDRGAGRRPVALVRGVGAELPPFLHNVTDHRIIRDAEMMQLAPWAVAMLNAARSSGGRGTILWPDIDEGTRARSATRIAYVRVCLDTHRRGHTEPRRNHRNVVTHRTSPLTAHSVRTRAIRLCSQAPAISMVAMESG